MKRADKIRLAQEQAAQEKAADTRGKDERDAARREWGAVRKAARDAFMAKKDWVSILNAYKEQPESFYTPAERERMVRAYTEELISSTIR